LQHGICHAFGVQYLGIGFNGFFYAFDVDNIYKGDFDIELFKIVGEELDINEQELIKILQDKIENGVKHFFIGFENAFNDENIADRRDNIKKVAIFLAGNSSKSPIVKELFEKYIEEFKKKNDNLDVKLHLPLQNSTDNPNRPNGKTGVAFGLIKSKEGGAVYIKNGNKKSEGEIKDKFKFYIGIQSRKKFKVLITKDSEYNNWIKAKPAVSSNFELYYSTSIQVIDNKCSINDSSIKKELLEVETSEEEKYVCIRIVSPTKVEYGVFAVDGDDIDEETIVGEIKSVELSE